MVSISIALSVGVLNLHFRGHKYYKLPNWIKTFLFMKTDHLEIYLKDLPRKSQTKNTTFNYANQNKQINNMRKTNNHVRPHCSTINENLLNKPNHYFFLETSNTKPKYEVKKCQKMNPYEEKIYKIMKMLRKCTAIIENESHKLKLNETLNYEWKEAARRLDFILFIISLSIIVSTPIYFFAPYLLEDYFKKIGKECGCHQAR